MSETVQKVISTNTSATERRLIYDKWSESYDKDVNDLQTMGPQKCAETLFKYISCMNKDIKILDVGAGTGLVGEQIHHYGFTNIEGLDPSEGMLEMARKKNVYRKLHCTYLTAEKNDFFLDDEYDIIVSSGSFVPGHLPYDVIKEMIRITKPGGIICLSVRLTAINSAEEYQGFFPLCDKLEKERRIQKEEITKYDGYLRGIEGLMIVYRVL